MSPRPQLTEDELAAHARQLVDATFRVAAETENAAPPVRAILQEAGLSRQVFYRCFRSSNDLLAAVLAEGRRILADYLARRMAKERTPEDKVRAWVTGVMRQAQSATERTRPFIVSPPLRYPGAEADEAEQIFASMLAGVIADGVAAGIWHSPVPMTDALVIHDFVFDSMRRHLSRDERPTKETIERLGDFALGGLVRGSGLAVHAGGA